MLKMLISLTHVFAARHRPQGIFKPEDELPVPEHKRLLVMFADVGPNAMRVRQIDERPRVAAWSLLHFRKRLTQFGELRSAVGVPRIVN